MIATGNFLFGATKVKEDVGLPGWIVSPGEVGIIYGKTGSGKSKLISEMAKCGKELESVLIDLEKQPFLRDFETLEFFLNLRNYSRQNIFIDNLYLLDGGVKTYHRLRDIQRIAIKNNYRVWVTLQQNRVAEMGYFYLHNTDPNWGMPIMSMASFVVHVTCKDGSIYGEIVKNRYGATTRNQPALLGKAKYMGAKK